MGFTAAATALVSVASIASVSGSALALGRPQVGPEQASWVATVKVNLKALDSVGVADAVSAMSETVVMDYDDGACLFETFIRGAGHDEKEMSADVIIKSTSEGNAKCTAAAGDYLSNKVADFKEHAGVTVISVERETLD